VVIFSLLVVFLVGFLSCCSGWGGLYGGLVCLVGMVGIYLIFFVFRLCGCGLLVVVGS